MAPLNARRTVGEISPPALTTYSTYRAYYDDYQLYWQFVARHPECGPSGQATIPAAHDIGTLSGNILTMMSESDSHDEEPIASVDATGQDQAKNTTPVAATVDAGESKDSYSSVVRRSSDVKSGGVSPLTQSDDLEATKPKVKAASGKPRLTPAQHELRLMALREGKVASEHDSANFAECVLALQGLVTREAITQMAREGRLPKTQGALFNLVDQARRLQAKRKSGKLLRAVDVANV
jgi:hypothetical protein